MSRYIKKEDAENIILGSCDESALWKLRHIPPADVVEVRHGHWDEDMECSICGCLAPVSHVTGEEYAYDYCPNCGAKMDGEEQKRNIFLDESIDETAGYGEEQEHE